MSPSAVRHLPTGPLPVALAELLDLVAADWPADRLSDYARLVDALGETAREHAGLVSLNPLRAKLSTEHGLSIHPRRYSALVRRARLDGLIVVAGVDVSDDHAGHNAGKPQRLYRATARLAALVQAAM